MKPGDSGNNCNSDDQLPDGWTVKVKVSASGKKYKCYFPPSGEGKFYSKLEVARFLKRNNPKSDEKENCIEQHSLDKFVVEKSEPEGLPLGWTKEIKVTKRGHKIRRDPYYTDPVSGYVFRSMKDALRYLETGEVGRLAFKPKDTGNDNVELEDDKTCTSATAKKQKLAANETPTSLISAHSSKLIEVAKDEHAISSASTGESLPISEHTSGHCVLGLPSQNSEAPEGKSSSQTVRKSDLTNGALATAVDVLSIEQPSESGEMKDVITKAGLGKSKKKKDLSLPRRASKRLAGLPLDPTPELKTINRVRRGAVGQSNDIAAITDESSSPAGREAKHASDTSKNTKRLESNKGKHPIGHMHAPSELKTENKGNEKHEHPTVSPSRSLTFKEEHAGNMETDNNADEKLGVPLDLPLGELWQDPCIAFAIKTLTGISFENSEGVQVSSGSNNSECGGLSALEDNARKEDLQNREPEKQVQHLSNIISHDVEISNKEKPGSPLNVDFADPWADPCIQFAIKTLTGAIPLACDRVIQDCLQQKASSSQSQESSGLILQNVGEPDQTEVFCQQFSISPQPSYNQGALPPKKKVSLGYPSGTIYQQHNDERSKEIRR
ncbi:uncharacterized protein LOC8258265 isoform X1 [Ricinus communis]|uniref:uncharacterized protein LOC8258265 isoform X1 n=1 Tax=Ricinus communis TaxID=3988 RepID=UPI00077237F0|nr:uncharacterized protein LOC8258265 isoform X1 [Ricinus communis]|eukprot:XP_015581605.1 uncharacterized protein LOC8258265 isoform X1 [Ricinus communis]